MTDVPEMVERVARAMATRVRYKIDEGNPAIGRRPGYLVYTEEAWQQLAEGAIAAIEAYEAALAAAGLVIVPREPTELMLDAGSSTVPGLTSPSEARAVWQFMLRMAAR